MMNEKMVMTRLVTMERIVLKGSLHIIPDVHSLFTYHRLEWMARSLGSYSEEIVREFYASYMQTLPSVLDKRSKPVKQDLLTEVLVRGYRVDISSTSICRFMYGRSTDAVRVPLTPEFDYR